MDDIGWDTGWCSAEYLRIAKELAAMRTIAEAVSSLSPDAQVRALWWAFDRFVVTTPKLRHELDVLFQMAKDEAAKRQQEPIHAE